MERRAVAQHVALSSGLATALAVAALCAGCAAPTPVDLQVTHIRVDRSLANIEALQSVQGALVGGGREYVDAYVRPMDLARLRLLAVGFEVVAEDYRRLRPSPPGDYHDNAGVEQALEDLASAHPDLVRVIDVGSSRSNVPIVGVLLTAEARARKAKRAMRLLGLHHGDEWSSMEVTLAVAEELATRYATDAGVAALLDEVEVWLVPVVNPDGLDAFTRGNARGVDLNRNYSHFWKSGSGGGSAPFSEPETDAIRALSLRRSFAQSLSYHSGAVCCNYIWNYTHDDAADEALARHMCELYEDTTGTPGFWTTNGADWYVTNGDTNDWSYGVRGGIDYTLEATSSKTPSAGDISEYVGWHVEPTLAFLQAGMDLGVVGTVSDVDTGTPLEAKVTNGAQGWPVYADPDTGLFHRMLFPGTHTLQVEAPGYRGTRVDVSVAAGAATRIDVALSRQASGGATLSALEPSVLSRQGGRTRVRLVGSGLAGWATAAELGRWDGATRELTPTSEGGELYVDIDPGDLEPEYSQEGIWWLRVAGDDGEVALPRALLVADEQKGRFELARVSAENNAAGSGSHRVRVQGSDLPRGSDLLLVGPGGAVAVPRAVEDQQGGELVALFDGAELVDGKWDVVMYGRGHYRALDDALQSRDGLFVGASTDDGDQPVDPGPYPSQNPVSEPADPREPLDPGRPDGSALWGSTVTNAPSGWAAVVAPAAGRCAAVGANAQPPLAFLVVVLAAVSGRRARSRRPGSPP